MFGRHVLILDLDHRKVGRAQFGISQITGWFGEDGSCNKPKEGRGWWSARSVTPRLDANDPGFQQLGNEVSFTIPPVLNLPPGRWKLTIDGKNNI